MVLNRLTVYCQILWKRSNDFLKCNPNTFNLHLSSVGVKLGGKLPPRASKQRGIWDPSSSSWNWSHKSHYHHSALSLLCFSNCPNTMHKVFTLERLEQGLMKNASYCITPRGIKLQKLQKHMMTIPSCGWLELGKHNLSLLLKSILRQTCTTQVF